MADNLFHTTDQTFEKEVLESNVPVIVDFWAEWCMPCRMIAPSLEALSNEMEGKVKIAKLDIEANPQTAGRYGIRSIPTLLVFKNGTVADQIIGAVPKAVIKQKIQAVI